MEQVNCFNGASVASSTPPQLYYNAAGGAQYQQHQNNNNNSNHHHQQNQQVYERHVKLLAKVLQTMANMTECKEPYMQPLSEFLNQNKSRIVKFIDEIATPNPDNDNDDNDDPTTRTTSTLDDRRCHGDDDDDDEADEDLKHAECKYLATLHRLLSSLVPQMKAHLVTVTSETAPAVAPTNDEFVESLRTLVDILEDISRRATAKTWEQIFLK